MAAIVQEGATAPHIMKQGTFLQPAWATRDENREYRGTRTFARLGSDTKRQRAIDRPIGAAPVLDSSNRDDPVAFEGRRVYHDAEFGIRRIQDPEIEIREFENQEKR